MRDPNFVYGGGLVTEQGLRRMTRWGWSILAVWAATLVTWGVLWPEPYAGAWWLAFELCAFGRTVCAYDGIRLGYSSLFLMLQGGTQDIGFFLVAFPWVIRFYEHVTHVPFIGPLLTNITHAAERHRKLLAGFGIPGLFLFVFFPISGTGTLIGSVIGYLLGMRMRMVMPVVITGHLTSLAVLLAFFDWLEPILVSLNQGVAQYFAWVLLALMVLFGWLYSVINSAYSRGSKLSEIKAFSECEASAEAGD